MGFLKKLGSLLSPPEKSGASGYWVAVRCKRCGEIIRTRVNLSNDLSQSYAEGNRTVYFCRKTLIGDQGCFQRVEVELTFDEERQLIDRQVSGGEFVESA